MTVFTGARLYLTTAAFETDVTFSTETHSGFYAVRVAPVRSLVRLPGTVLEGYVLRSAGEPRLIVTSATRPAELAVDGAVSFALDSELIQLRYPVPILAVTGHPRLAVPVALIRKAEPFSGRFDRRGGVGEPLDLPAYRALLLAAKPPLYSCRESYTELKSVFWISYDPRVGKKELAPLCAHYVKPARVDALLRHAGVFPVDYPVR